jgi:pilus assembly protein CpaF
MEHEARGAESLHQLACHYRDRIIAERDIRELASMARPRLSRTLETIVQKMMADERRILTRAEAGRLVEFIRNEIVGFGPLEPLLARDDVSEIMVVGPDEVYLEAGGCIRPAPVQFRDEQHVRHIVDRMIAAIGRRLDDSCPMVDARLPVSWTSRSGRRQPRFS